jgi:hypothetical protein
LVSHQIGNEVVAQAVEIILRMNKASEGTFGPIHQIEPTASRNPKLTVAVLDNVEDHIVTDRARVFGIMEIPGECSRLTVEEIQATTAILRLHITGSDPQAASTVFENRPYGIEAEAVRIAGIVHKALELATGSIQAIDPTAPSAYPEIALSVLV